MKSQGCQGPSEGMLDAEHSIPDKIVKVTIPFQKQKNFFGSPKVSVAVFFAFPFSLPDLFPFHPR